MVEQDYSDYLRTTNPQSLYYDRKLIRPIINWWTLSLRCVLPAIVFFFEFRISCAIGLSKQLGLCICLASLVGYSLLQLRHTIVSVVQLYQHFAPDKVRKKCRFEPSCSQYMIEAVEKYGAFVGLKKSLIRLSKCNNRKHGSGGFDYP